jgi:antagonist of KipI
VQVPNDGAPIMLMVDHQTTGGYPKIAEIASADIPALAQTAPGGGLRFVACSLSEAQKALGDQRQRFQSVRRVIEWKLGSLR